MIEDIFHFEKNFFSFFYVYARFLWQRKKLRFLGFFHPLLFRRRILFSICSKIASYKVSKVFEVALHDCISGIDYLHPSKNIFEFFILTRRLRIDQDIYTPFKILSSFVWKLPFTRFPKHPGCSERLYFRDRLFASFEKYVRIFYSHEKIKNRSRYLYIF